ncbi:PREDICTED: programmed cell death protein 2-like isoform X2 [Nelumbo nucifera]|uniref:Programmed cell death protein 2-like isoform X2 n=1 Tax=Nelumbo nucifera TaxID=4432 RepID=A0A1U8A252_NELNU|nr:PREDICTED: programmed cell death protein 2-like isoform X2 [Nelumbo nucifera]
MMGKVILGVPGPWAENNLELSDHYTTKIGGLPDWPIPELIHPSLLECGACGSNLCLVAQIYAPISTNSLRIEERTLYIFGCVMSKCGNSSHSWRALRVQKSYSGEEPAANCQEVSSLTTCSGTASNSSNWWEDDLWIHNSGADNVGDSEDVDLEDLGKALAEAASLASHSKKQDNCQSPESVEKCSSVRPSARLINASTPVVPCFYIYSQEEASSRGVSAICSKSSPPPQENKCDLDDHKDEETWEEEGYEYDRALDVDRTYLKFKKRMDAYPEQCFRYVQGGKPLLATKDLGEPGTCKLCGGSRHYEFQLMPPLLYFLQEGNDGQLTHLPDWNWMTLIVYTCSKNCSQRSSDGKSNIDDWTVSEEAIIIQFENPLHGSARQSYFS